VGRIVKHSLHLSWTLLLLTVASGFSTGKQSVTRPHEDPKDTVKALVTYGNDFLFEQRVDFSHFDIQERVDSLIGLDSLTPYQWKELEFYKSVSRKSEDEMYEMIDSLFELDVIPYALINQINLYIALMPRELHLPSDFEIVKEDGSPYPANHYYKSWNSRAAFDYSPQLMQQDSVLVLVLAQPSLGQQYHHPLCEKTINRYFGTVTSPYGWRDGRAHNGVDLELHLYDSVLNMFDGKVRLAQNYQGYGKVVIVRHYNGLETLYAHLSKIKVKEGDIIKAGDLVGLGGMTGHASGTHLHLEMRFKGVPINPAHIISFQDRELYADTLIVKRVKSNYIVYPYNTHYHVVKKGESPYSIAKRYGIKIEQLCEFNCIEPKTRLVVGQKIRIDSGF
jgi:murein DD-endopeptidase MepM/ murein hydrolase activator NlpD